MPLKGETRCHLQQLVVEFMVFGTDGLGEYVRMLSLCLVMAVVALEARKTVSHGQKLAGGYCPKE